MAKSTYHQEQYSSRGFVESAGAILFDFRHTGISLQQLLHPQKQHGTGNPAFKPASEPTVALIYSNSRKQTLLPKGRRNIDEPRKKAALRETYEETGLKCQLLPITLHSRATSVDPSQDRINSGGYTTNEVRSFNGTTDPFWMTVRHAKDEQGNDHVKVIFWYVAVVDEEQGSGSVTLDPGCELRALPISEAEEACSFEDDRKVLKEALRIVRETLEVRHSASD